MKALPSIRSLALGICALAAVAVLAIPAKALLVQPIVIEMQSVGSGANAAIEVVNDRNTPVTVEVTTAKLIVPEQGGVTTEADDGADFLIFPPQAVLQPGAKQVFRVRWVGEPDIDKTRMYMFTTSELPVGLPEGVTGVELYYAVQSIVTVTPPAARPEVVISRVERSGPEDSIPGVRLTFQNTGFAHAYVGNSQMTLTSGDWRQVVGPEAMSGAIGLGLIPPQASRTLFVPVENVPASGEITATYELVSPR